MESRKSADRSFKEDAFLQIDELCKDCKDVDKTSLQPNVRHRPFGSRNPS